MGLRAKDKKEVLVAYVSGSDLSLLAQSTGVKSGTIRKWWLDLDLRGRLEIERIVLADKLQQMIGNHQKMLDAITWLLEQKCKPGALQQAAMASGILQDKITMMRQELADVEAKLGTGRKVRPKNTVRVESG
jgi:hypothetical protein